MRKIFKQISIVLFFSLGICQQESYRSVDDIKEEWSGYTSYQKEEMISFSEFLYKEKHYERCLLSLFELLYKFPNDPVLPNIEYHIARCYEEMSNYALARRYYLKVVSTEPSSSFVSRAANYRSIYLSLLDGNESDVLSLTIGSEDPYLISFRGYAHLQNQEWEEARLTFIAAQSAFNHPHYDGLIIPLYKVIEDVGSLPIFNKYIVFFSGAVIPGGGHFLLKDKSAGQGILASVAMMLLTRSWGKGESLAGNKRFISSEGNSLPIYKNYKGEGVNKALENRVKIPESLNLASSSFKYIVPPILIGGSLFIASSIQSFFDTKKKNQDLVDFYLVEELTKIPPARFLDFAEPSLKLVLD